MSNSRERQTDFEEQSKRQGGWGEGTWNTENIRKQPNTKPILKKMRTSNSFLDLPRASLVVLVIDPDFRGIGRKSAQTSAQHARKQTPAIDHKHL